MRLRKSIDTYNNLPVANNFIGDVRRVLDTNLFYVWSSQNSSDTLANWKCLGIDVEAIIWGSITGDIEDQLDLVDKLNEKVTGHYDTDYKTFILEN